MALFVCVPVRFPGMFGGNAAGDDGDPAPLLHPFDEFVSVVAFVRQDDLPRQVKRL